MNKKGIIFTFDAGLALFLVLSIILISSFYITKADRQAWSKIYVMRTMQDSIVVLDNMNILQTLNLTLIENKTADLLGLEYNFSFLIEEYDSSYTIIQDFSIRTPTKKNIFVNTGHYLFFTTDETDIEKYYWLKYWVWKKNE